MSNDSQKIIQEIIDLYLAQEHVDGQSAERFRAWFANDLHREEKDAALAKAFDLSLIHIWWAGSFPSDASR